jgi:hypothetical protein
LGGGLCQAALEVRGPARSFGETAAKGVDLDFEAGDLAA